jgi:hypothetical protein
MQYKPLETNGVRVYTWTPQQLTLQGMKDVIDMLACTMASESTHIIWG